MLLLLSPLTIFMTFIVLYQFCLYVLLRNDQQEQCMLHDRCSISEVIQTEMLLSVQKTYV